MVSARSDADLQRGTTRAETSDQRCLVQRQQLAPRALRLRGVVDGRALFDRHVGHAPAVPRGIDLDFGWEAGLGERVLQHGLGRGLAFVVVRRDAEIHPRPDSGCEEMRAVRLVGDEAAAMKRRGGADAPGLRGGGPDYEGATHAIALRPDLPPWGDLALRAEEGDA